MVFADYTCEFFNESINRWKFSSVLKYVNVTPVFKKDYRCSKENYRPVSILSVVSKIFEKILYKQLTAFADQSLSIYQCCFRKGYPAQHSIVAMLEKQKGAVDNKKVLGALLTDLSKTLNSLSNELLIAKINADGFSLPALRLIHDFSINRQQKTEINHAYSSQEEVVFGVSQGTYIIQYLFK